MNNSYQGYLLNWDLDLETRVVEQVQRVFKQARLMGREPVLLTRRKDFRFAIVRLLERYQVEAQVLCISELAPEIVVIKLPILNSRGEVMESTEKKEALMRIKAASKMNCIESYLTNMVQIIITLSMKV